MTPLGADPMSRMVLIVHAVQLFLCEGRHSLVKGNVIELAVLQVLIVTYHAVAVPAPGAVHFPMIVLEVSVFYSLNEYHCIVRSVNLIQQFPELAQS